MPRRLKISEKRLKSGGYASGTSEELSPEQQTLRRDMGRLTDKKSNARAVEAEKRLKLKSFKEEDFPL